MYKPLSTTLDSQARLPSQLPDTTEILTILARVAAFRFRADLRSMLALISQHVNCRRAELNSPAAAHLLPKLRKTRIRIGSAL